MRTAPRSTLDAADYRPIGRTGRVRSGSANTEHCTGAEMQWKRARCGARYERRLSGARQRHIWDGPSLVPTLTTLVSATAFLRSGTLGPEGVDLRFYTVEG